MQKRAERFAASRCKKKFFKGYLLRIGCLKGFAANKAINKCLKGFTVNKAINKRLKGFTANKAINRRLKGFTANKAINKRLKDIYCE